VDKSSKGKKKVDRQHNDSILNFNPIAKSVKVITTSSHCKSESVLQVESITDKKE
jgi:hypothetical protein